MFGGSSEIFQKLPNNLVSKTVMVTSYKTTFGFQKQPFA